MVGFLDLGHAWRYSEFTPGSTGQILWESGDQTWLSRVQEKFPPHCAIIVQAPGELVGRGTNLIEGRFGGQTLSPFTFVFLQNWVGSGAGVCCTLILGPVLPGRRYEGLSPSQGAGVEFENG